MIVTKMIKLEGMPRSEGIETRFGGCQGGLVGGWKECPDQRGLVLRQIDKSLPLVMMTEKAVKMTGRGGGVGMTSWRSKSQPAE